MQPAHPIVQRIYRHPLVVRIWHWINAICVVLLLMSGLQIFNAHPRLYWGRDGYDGKPAVFEISGDAKTGGGRSWVKIGDRTIPVTGILGEPKDIPGFGRINYAFPGWLTLPSGAMSLGRGRGWHFFAFWIFAINVTGYLLYGVATGRFRRMLIPARSELHPREVLRDILDHIRVRQPRTHFAGGYNLLQKLSYLVVVAMLLPFQILSGMALSNTALSIAPWILDVFGGRQSARTVHFVIAITIAAFLVIHVLQVFVAGFVNEMRSIVTGYFEIPPRSSDE